jgi:dihydroorotase
MSKLVTLGMSLSDVIACATWHPAIVLDKLDEIGTLREGSRADVTLLEVRRDDWEYLDGLGASLESDQRLVPTLVLRDGKPITPTGRLLRDVLTPEERGEDSELIAVGGRPR